MAHIPADIRQRVAHAARHRCGYCLTQESVIGMPLEIDHILPEALGGSNDESNLWLACPRCNRFKGAVIHAVDLDGGELVPLYNPRIWSWYAHFTWTNDGTIIVGASAIGRATVSALHMNNPFVVRARYVWVKWGWHPPQDAN